MTVVRVSLFESDPDRNKYARGTEEVEFNDLAPLILKNSWAPAVYKKDEAGQMHRSNENFESSDLLVLDVDDGCSLKEAEGLFQEYRTIIATTRSHQRDKVKRSGKVGPPRDRFRVIIPYSETVRSGADLVSTWYAAFHKWGFIDTACKDPARFFFECKDLIRVHEGRPFDVVTAQENMSQVSQPAVLDVAENLRGQLGRQTLDFIAFGAPSGHWHTRLVKAVFDLKQNLYTEQQAIELLTKACTNAQKQLDNSDFKNIRGIYKNYVPKYPPRVPDPKNAPKTYTSMTPEERRQRLAESNAFLDRARTHSTTFIHPVFDPYYRLVPGLTLIGARTGEGKSTVASNLVHRFVKDNPLKSVLYISNEETSADVLNRIACIDCKIPFKNFRERSLEAELVKRVTERAEALTTGIEVVEKPEFDMTALEDVQGVLNAAVTMENVGLIVIDYLQTIHKSTSQPTLEEIRVSKEMGHFLREYGKQATFPLVAFAQLKPRSEAAEFSARIHNDRTMLHHAVAGIEVKPDFKTLRTEFVMQKLRFGDSQGKSVFLKFAFGRFEPLSDEQLKELGSGKAESAKSFASFEKAMNELRENDDPAERTTQTTPDPPQALTTHLKTAPVRESD